jgi:hypothetical protein
MAWKSVGEKIVQDDQSKWDRKASAKELRVSETGALQGAKGRLDFFIFSGYYGLSFIDAKTEISYLCHSA